MPPPQSVGQVPFGMLVPERSSVETSSAAADPWPMLIRPQGPSTKASSQRSAQSTLPLFTAPVLGVFGGVAPKLTTLDGFDFISVSIRAPTRRPPPTGAAALMPIRVLLGWPSTWNHLLEKPSSANITARLTWP